MCFLHWESTLARQPDNLEYHGKRYTVFWRKHIQSPRRWLCAWENFVGTDRGYGYACSRDTICGGQASSYVTPLIRYRITHNPAHETPKQRSPLGSPLSALKLRQEGSIFHVLFAVDVPGDNVRIVTTYYPDTEEWEEDFKTRRRSL